VSAITAKTLNNVKIANTKLIKFERYLFCAHHGKIKL